MDDIIGSIKGGLMCVVPCSSLTDFDRDESVLEPVEGTGGCLLGVLMPTVTEFMIVRIA